MKPILKIEQADSLTLKNSFTEAVAEDTMIILSTDRTEVLIRCIGDTVLTTYRAKQPVTAEVA